MLALPPVGVRKADFPPFFLVDVSVDMCGASVGLLLDVNPTTTELAMNEQVRERIGGVNFENVPEVGMIGCKKL